MNMVKLVVYVPSEYAERVKQALFCSGAGTIGDYDQCCWQTMGVGQFRPLPGANPFRGEISSLERVLECRLELVCRAERVRPAVEAMLAAHPYEEPAYQLLPILDLEQF